MYVSPTTFHYKPTADSYRRAYRLRLLVNVAPKTVAREVVRAIENGHRHVSIPKRASLIPLAAEAPRRLVELLLTGVPHQKQCRPIQPAAERRREGR